MLEDSNTLDLCVATVKFATQRPGVAGRWLSRHSPFHLNFTLTLKS